MIDKLRDVFLNVRRVVDIHSSVDVLPSVGIIKLSAYADAFDRIIAAREAILIRAPVISLNDRVFVA